MNHKEILAHKLALDLPNKCSEVIMRLIQLKIANGQFEVLFEFIRESLLSHLLSQVVSIARSILKIFRVDP